MDLGDILSPQQVLPDMKAATRWEAIDELITQLIESSKIKPEHREAMLLCKGRERGHGVGIFHISMIVEESKDVNIYFKEN